MDIRAEVLKKIKPSAQEEERIRRFVNDLTAVAKTISGLDSVVVGSIGKQTWLSGDHDVDIFLIFDSSVSREELERLGLEYGRRISEELGGRHHVKYAEHPYTSAKIRGFEVDIVPCYRIAHGEKIKSAVDRSPLHMRYILDYMKPSMHDEVRLLKQFCKGVGVYGSDAKNLGFSGYICELIILNYGTFEKAVASASEWRPPFMINVERHLGVSMSRFRDQSLVIIDPVDPERNVAAVVSGENFIKFVSSAKSYTKKPSPKFFWGLAQKPLSSQQLKSLQERGTFFMAIRFERPDIIDDTLYPQLRSSLARLSALLQHEEFRVLRSVEFAETVPTMVFEMEVWTLPKVKSMIGPPIFSEKHSEEFLGKYAKNFVYVDENRWVAEVARKSTTATGFLNDFLKQKPPALAEAGIPANIAAQVSGEKILAGKDFWSLVKKDKSLSDYLRKEYFEDDSKGFQASS